MKKTTIKKAAVFVAQVAFGCLSLVSTYWSFAGLDWLDLEMTTGEIFGTEWRTDRPDEGKWICLRLWCADDGWFWVSGRVYPAYLLDLGMKVTVMYLPNHTVVRVLSESTMA